MKETGTQCLLVDTNIFLRFLAGDDPSKALACKELFQRAEAKEIELHTNELVVAEVAWTLRSSYGRTKGQIVEAPRAIISLPGLRIPRKVVLLDAVELYERDFEEGKSHVSPPPFYRVRRAFTSTCSDSFPEGGQG